ncbi:hypothetical protein E2320_007145, partial [Naja naja]
MSFPNPCPVGTYNPLQGQDESTDCRACPAGNACTQTGLAQPDSECMFVQLVLQALIPPTMRVLLEHSAIILISLINPSVKLVQRDWSVQEAQEESKGHLSHAQQDTTALQVPNIQCNTSVPLARGATGQVWPQKKSVHHALQDGFVWQEPILHPG